MSIQYAPIPGQILICDYETGFRPPEMCKRRLAVVLSPRLPYRDNLCTVVPLSTTPPRRHLRYQCKIELPFAAPPPFDGVFKFAKADMLATVCFDRLSMPYKERDKATGRRKYLKMILAPEEFAKVRNSVIHALGLNDLTQSS